MSNTTSNKTRYNHLTQPRNSKGRFQAQHTRQPIANHDRFLRYLDHKIAATVVRQLAETIELTFATDRIGLRDIVETAASGRTYVAVYVTGVTSTEHTLLGALSDTYASRAWDLMAQGWDRVETLVDPIDSLRGFSL